MLSLVEHSTRGKPLNIIEPLVNVLSFERNPLTANLRYSLVIYRAMKGTNDDYNYFSAKGSVTLRSCEGSLRLRSIQTKSVSCYVCGCLQLSWCWLYGGRKRLKHLVELYNLWGSPFVIILILTEVSSFTSLVPIFVSALCRIVWKTNWTWRALCICMWDLERYF